MLEISSNKRFMITELHSAFITLRSPSFKFYGESHDFWEIVCVLSGVVGISAGSTVATLRAGQAVIHPPMEFHKIWAEADTAPEYIVLSFSAKNMPTLKGQFFKLSDSMQQEAKNILDSFNQVFDINFIINAIKPGQEQNAKKALSELEYFVLNLVLSEPDIDVRNNSANARTFAKIVSVMDKNVSKKLSVSEIADLCFLSESNMKRIFSEFAGCGIMKYFSLKKAEYAKTLLQNGHSVSEVSEMLDFPDRAYFSTWYKRITGEHPGKQKLK